MRGYEKECEVRGEARGGGWSTPLPAELPGRVDEESLQPLLDGEAHQVFPRDGATHLD